MVKAFSLPQNWSLEYLFDFRTIGYSHFDWKVFRARIAYVCILLESIGPPFPNQSENSHYICFATAVLLHPSQKNSSILFLVREQQGPHVKLLNATSKEIIDEQKGVSSGVCLSSYVHTVPKSSSQLPVPAAKHPVMTSGKYRFIRIKIQYFHSLKSAWKGLSLFHIYIPLGK